MKFVDTQDYINKYRTLLDNAEKCFYLLNESEIQAIVEYSPERIREINSIELRDADDDFFCFDENYNVVIDEIQTRCNRLVDRYDQLNESAYFDYIHICADRERIENELLIKIHNALDIGNFQNYIRAKKIVYGILQNKNKNCLRQDKHSEISVKYTPEILIGKHIDYIFNAVNSVAGGSKAPIEDLLMDAILEALQNMDKFDTNYGFSFISYISRFFKKDYLIWQKNTEIQVFK